MIDTHCHLADPKFQDDLESVLKRAHSAGIEKIINIGYDTETSQRVVQMAQRYSWLLPGVGIHPQEASARTIKEIAKITELIENYSVSAVGETGLDYHWHTATPRDQKILFHRHIELAKRLRLPLIIHTRKSFDDTIEILKTEDARTGVFHCFTGNYEAAKKVLDMGFFISFAGNLTFDKGLQDVLKKIGPQRILLETDAPYLTPIPYRGKRNEPAFILETLKKAAEIMHIPAQRLEDIISDNASKLFSC